MSSTMNEGARKVGVVAGVFVGLVHLLLQASETFARTDSDRIKYPMTWRAHVLDEPSVIVPFAAKTRTGWQFTPTR